MSDARTAAPATRGIRTRRAIATAVLIVVAAGCKSPEKKAAEQLKTVDSWAATAQLTGQSWLDGSVPTVYARQTFEAAKSAMRQSEQRLARTQLRADERDDLMAALREREGVVELMRSGVEANDRGVVALQLRRLADFGHGLTALAQRMTGP